jgi:hypothetical protein
MAFIGNNPTDVPLTGSQIANGTIVNANVASNTLNLTQKVTSTLPFANGGTGLSTLGTAGQALVVNSGATALQYSTVGAAAGQVIQVVSATDSTQRSTSSSTFVTGSTTLSVSITPSAAANKILVLVGVCAGNADGNFANFTVFRGATNLGNGNSGFLSMNRVDDTGDDTAGFAVAFLDSPNTTSSTTYGVQFRGGNVAFLNLGSSTGSITLMEIKG